MSIEHTAAESGRGPAPEAPPVRRDGARRSFGAAREPALMRVGRLIGLLAACSPRPGKNPFEVEPTPIEGPARTVCEMARYSDAVVVGRSWVREADLIQFSNSAGLLPFTRFELEAEQTIKGEPPSQRTNVYVRGGLRNGSNVGGAHYVTDGGRGVWFCDSVDGALLAGEGGLMHEEAPNDYHGIRYVDAGVSLEDIRTMSAWDPCGTRAYP